GIVSQIATLAERFPDVASEVLESDGLTALGTAICLEGSAAAGQKALDISWRLSSGEASSAAIDAGEVWRIPLAAGTRAEVSLFPARLVDVGLGQPGASANTQVEGGRLGLIVDARLRHLAGNDGELERSWRALEAYA
ncbi:MAG: hypothetical protein KGJ86_20710, partial [Chloroflexota bacterium]|nr:hypothetical protein [Chloroflexota bacterium]